MTALQYTPLPISDTIRLLRLHQGAASDQLKCTLQPVSLRSAPSYEAVSYCWGQEPKSALINCNNTIIPVKSNLFNLLIVFRNVSSDRLLWVDAICINQSDATEKTNQVGMMFQIYQNATRVLSWIGEPTESSWIDKSLISKLLEARQKWKSSTPEQEFSAYNYIVTSPNLNATYLATAKLAERDYFKRVWIIQEIAANKDVLLQCGNTNISFYDYIRALQSIPWDQKTQVQTFFATTVFQAQHFQSFSTSSTRKSTLLELLVRHRPSQATVGLDKVFALCGLASDIRNGTLENPVNFAANKTQVLHKLAIAMLESYKNLDILSIGRSWDRTETGYDTASLGFPSWVPNWTLSDYGENILDLHTNRDLNPQFHASRHTKYDFRVSSDQRRLFVMGYTLDVISARGQKIGRNNMSLGRIGEIVFNDWKIIAIGNRKEDEKYVTGTTTWYEKYVTGTTTLYDAYWQASTCGRANDSNSRRDFQYAERELGSQPTAISQWSISYIRTTGWCDCNTMIRTRGGYIGQAPAFVEPGDHVLLFTGAKVPIVVRRRESGWEVLGDCYIHGIMFGEAFEERRCNVIELI